MPRDGSGDYDHPGSGGTVATNELSSSTKYNAQIDDIKNTFNEAAPVKYGGTGATSAADARTNLAVPPNTRLINTGNGLTGGGNLSADRTLAASYASQAQAEAGTNTTKLMNALRTAQAIAALGHGEAEIVDQWDYAVDGGGTSIIFDGLAAHSLVMVLARDMDKGATDKTTFSLKENSGTSDITFDWAAINSTLEDFLTNVIPQLTENTAADNMWTLLLIGTGLACRTGYFAFGGYNGDALATSGVSQSTTTHDRLIIEADGQSFTDGEIDVIGIKK